MTARRDDSRRRTGAAALVLSLLALLAACVLLPSCAQVEPPLGGPEDETPPQLLATVPDSGAVGLGEVRSLEFLFSEKVALVPAERLLRFYPDVEVAKTRWQGRRRLIVELAEPLPADTVVVVELPSAYKDNHGVTADRHRTLVLATLDSLPTGRVRALVTLEGEPAGRAAL
ncbi:Ig-like domain-containing protein, partial [bacterium]|nr:Ig-like domain-containing protein [bacterium]